MGLDCFASTRLLSARLSHSLAPLPASGGIIQLPTFVQCLLDDEESVLDMSREVLEDLGYKVTAFSHPRNAVEFFKVNWQVVNLVILDMIMPVLSGSDVFRILKKINPSVKIILCSGYGTEQMAENMLRDGAAGFLKKPYKVTELSDIVAGSVK